MSTRTDGKAGARMKIEKLDAGESRDVEFAFDTTLRPDAYTVTVSAGVRSGSRQTSDERGSKPAESEVSRLPLHRVVETYPVTLVARHRAGE